MLIHESQLVPFAALVIAITTFVYAVRNKIGDNTIRNLERRIDELMVKEQRCSERLAALELLNQDLLLRLAGIRPMGDTKRDAR
mgnify:CR=1 FL=1